MSARILEGGGLLGGYSFDKTEAEPDTHLAGQIDDDVVGAMVRLQCLSDEYQHARHYDDARRRCVVAALHAAISVFARQHVLGVG